MKGRFADAAPKRKKKGLPITLCALLVLAGLLAAAWFATADLRSYHKGRQLLEAGQYDAAAAIFEALSDYEDAPEYQLEARYGIACQQMDNREYLDAAERFAQLGDYRDSGERLGKCFYSLATSARLAKEYAQARDYFAMAGDYQDAATQVQRMIYALGHEAFLAGDYDTADGFFAQLEGTQQDYGNPHFRTLSDAAEYLDSQLEELSDRVCFHVGEEPDEAFYLGLRNYLPFHYGSPSYYDADKLVTISILSYYPGDVILDAWEKGDVSGLDEDEKEVLDLALELVAQAEAETDSDLEKEVWLHDWLCQKVFYESPDMDIKAREYVELRELSCIGAMLDGKANCQGYTDTFYLLGNLAGFEVRRLVGDAGEGHIWNMIRLDGAWYVVDVTFDDLSDEDYDGWTYTHFNAPLDPEVYDIWGGEAVLPGIAEAFNAEYSYFALNGGSFSDVGTAANYLVQRRASRGDDWAYAVLEGMEVEWDDFSQAIKNNLPVFGILSASWVEWLEYYDGNTYMSVCWDA